jgi:hypothetical protein
MQLARGDEKCMPNHNKKAEWKRLFGGMYIVTDLMNALPGNSSVNTVQHATIEEAVFFCRSDRRANRLAE